MSTIGVAGDDIGKAASPRLSSIALSRYRHLLGRGKTLRHGMADIKNKAPLSHIPSIVPDLYRSPFHRNLIAPGAFPKVPHETKFTKLIGYRNLERELIWSACVLKCFETELAQFVRLEATFFDHHFGDEVDAADATLSEIEREFGFSIWLATSRIEYLEATRGHGQQKSYAVRLLRSKLSPWYYLFVYYASLRSELALSSGGFLRFSNSLVEHFEPSASIAYVKWHLLPGTVLNADIAATIFAHEETSPIVDRYLTFIRICQRLCTDSAQGPERAQAVARVRDAIAAASLDVADPRLRMLRYICGLDSEPRFSAVGSASLGVYDAYAQGMYQTALDQAVTLLRLQPARADLFAVAVKAGARAQPDNAPWAVPGLAGNIIKAMTDVLLRTPDYAKALEILEKTSLTFAHSPISTHISGFLARERSALAIDELSPLDLLSCLNSPIGNPWQHRTFLELAPALTPAGGLVAICGKSPSIELEVVLASEDSDPALALGTLRRLGLPEDRADLYSARVLEQRGRLAEASRIYEHLLSSDYPPTHFEAAKRLTWVYLRNEEYPESLLLVAQSYLRNQQSFISLPIEELLFRIERKGAYSFAASLSSPIVYDIYAKHIGPIRDGERSDACEDFLNHYGLTRPSELREYTSHMADQGLKSFDQNMLIYYLRYICVPRIMDSSTAFQGTKDLLEERIAICQFLTEIDPDNSGAYTDEIRSITQEVLVNEGVRYIEQSRIYVDTDGIRQSLEKALVESFRRYQAMLVLQGIDDAYQDLMKALSELAKSKRYLIISRVSKEQDALFIAMIETFYEQFVISSVHGLAGYLSGRIRHGILSNHLRSPLEVAHLVTQRNSATGTYRRNEYWLARCGYDDDLSENDLPERVDQCLASFAETIDSLIETVNSGWMQIRRDSTPDGMFDFILPEIEWRALQSEVSTETSYEEFVERLFQCFWDLTERNLTRIRHRFDTELKRRLNEAFDKLQIDITDLHGGAATSELNTAVATARTDMQVTLDRVKDWFRLSKSADKPDLSLATLIDVAVQSTNNCFRHSPLKPTITVRGDYVLRGNVLASLVEVLWLFLSNVIGHSGVQGRAPATTLGAEVTQDIQLVIVVENETAFDSEADERAAFDHVEGMQNVGTADAIGSLAVREGGTGFAKVGKILKHDLGCNYHLTFGFTPNGSFRVQIEIDARTIVAQ